MVFSRIIFAAILLLNSTAKASSDPVHSKVEVTQGKSEQKLSFTFKVKANDGMALTLDAPWKLEVESKELQLPKTSWSRADLDSNLPGFLVETSSKPKDSKGKFSYTLTAFVCTKEKTQCYREVHKGNFDWTQSKP